MLYCITYITPIIVKYIYSTRISIKSIRTEWAQFYLKFHCVLIMQWNIAIMIHPNQFCSNSYIFARSQLYIYMQICIFPTPKGALLWCVKKFRFYKSIIFNLRNNIYICIYLIDFITYIVLELLVSCGINIALIEWFGRKTYHRVGFLAINLRVQ